MKVECITHFQHPDYDLQTTNPLGKWKTS